MAGFSIDDLKGMKPRRGFLVGIDSDGCVFPTMEIKQKQCFHPEIIRAWGLQAIEREVREAAEFVNLYSVWRGINRFPALLRVMELLRSRPEVAAAGVRLPDMTALRRYIESGVALSNATLREEVERTGDQEIQRVLEWSLAVNRTIERTVTKVPPFRWVRESLEKMRHLADIIVVSQTPEEALIREWRENDLDAYPRVIAGQELGTKAEHLRLASDGRYPAHRILMIGDAPGDRKAAQAVGACFFPVNPGHEEASWKRLHDEALDRFIQGAYAGAYETTLVAEFTALLPEQPPWKKD